MFKEVVSEVDISEIPLRYIAAAMHLNLDGTENVVYGDDLIPLMAREAPYEYVGDINVLLDMRLLAIDMSQVIAEIFDYILFGDDDVGAADDE